MKDFAFWNSSWNRCIVIFIKDFLLKQLPETLFDLARHGVRGKILLIWPFMGHTILDCMNKGLLILMGREKSQGDTVKFVEVGIIECQGCQLSIGFNELMLRGKEIVYLFACNI